MSGRLVSFIPPLVLAGLGVLLVKQGVSQQAALSFIAGLGLVALSGWWVGRRSW